MKRIYIRVKAPNDNIDNVLSIIVCAHILWSAIRPCTKTFYINRTTPPKWYLESIGVYVSYLNHCDYCVQHHLEGFKRLLDDDPKTLRFWKEVQSDKLETYFDAKYFEGIRYAKTLTNSLSTIQVKDIERL